MVLLKHLITQEKVSSRHASWIAYLQQFTFLIKHTYGITFVIKHTYGISNRVADALSRQHSLLSVLHVSVPGFSTSADMYLTNL